MLKDSVLFSDKLGDEYVGIEHIFFSIINLKKGSTVNYLATQSIDSTKFIKDYVLSLKFQDIDNTFSSEIQVDEPKCPNSAVEPKIFQYILNLIGYLVILFQSRQMFIVIVHRRKNVVC